MQDKIQVGAISAWLDTDYQLDENWNDSDQLLVFNMQGSYANNPDSLLMLILDSQPMTDQKLTIFLVIYIETKSQDFLFVHFDNWE